MFRLECPYCDRVQDLRDEAHGRTIKCPGCGRFYQVNRTWGRPLAAADSGTDPFPREAELPAVLLTVPHRCQVVGCARLIDQPVRRSRDTIVCPHCEAPTSIYAVLHRCPGCWALLESPLRDADSESHCPRCRQQLRVPAPLLSRTVSRKAPGNYFFRCPNCRCSLQTDPRFAYRWSVCPGCRGSFRIPPHGESAAVP